MYYARKDIRRSGRSSSNGLQRGLSTHGLTAKKAVTASDISTTGDGVVSLINTMQQIMTLLRMRETGCERFSFLRRAVCRLIVEKRRSSLHVHTLQPSACLMPIFLRNEERNWRGIQMSSARQNLMRKLHVI
jgi:hypothetical protein